jgi:uncharacterized membrane protein HdeD (DUF308 family)
MSSHIAGEGLNPRYEERLHLHKCWLWFIVLGIALMLVGGLAIASAFVTGLATVFLFGCLLLGSGVVQIVNAVLARSWRGFFVNLAVGVLHLVLGAFMVENPLRAIADLTLVLALAFVVGGIIRIVIAMVERFDNWQWMLLSGLITFLLGVAIWRRWPESSEWVIGTFVGVDLLFSGWSWVTLGLLVKEPSGSGKKDFVHAA